MQTETKSIKIREDTYNRLKEYCNKNDLKMTFIIDHAVKMELKNKSFERNIKNATN